ncbi:MAG: biotin/lipoyl-binding protein [Fimbriimonadaceae bacterium]|nr:biotin/lipoyl-binding protein [Fimbriimonadaceae bacterium]
MRHLVNGREVELTADPSVTVVRGPDRLVVHTPEGTSTALVTRVGAKTLVSVGGRQFEVSRATRERSGEGAQGSGTKLAPMPGLVVDVFVEQDQCVAVGDKLLVLEAMKMQHVVTADVAGKVSALPVAKGQQVSEGDLLVRVEPSAGVGHGDKDRGS